MYNRILTDGLLALGVDVKIVALDQELPGVSLHDSGNSTALRKLMGVLLRKHSPDFRVILIDSWLYRYFWHLAWRARLRGHSRLVVYSQLCYWDTYHAWLYRTQHRLQTLAALVPAHYNIGVSATVLQADLGPWRRASTSEVIPPGCDYLGKVVAQADCARLPAQIISVGNYTPRKGYHILIAALALVVQQHPELRDKISLRLVGNQAYNPDYIAKLRGQIAAAGLEDQVILDGWIARDALSQAFAAAQLFAFASESEGYGMVVMEAMLHGLPVLLGDFKTAPELVGTDPACGYVVPRHDPRAFARAIIDYFTRRDRAGMGEHVRARALATALSWQDVILKYKRVIEAHS